MYCKQKIAPLLLFCLLFSCLFCFPQQSKIDSLYTLIKKDKGDTNKVIHLNELCMAYQNIGKYDTALYHEKVALQLANQLNFQKGIGNAYLNIGIIYLYQGSYENALVNYLKALKIFDEIGNKKGIADSYNNIGLIYWYQGNYENALVNYLKALKIFDEIGNKKGIASEYNNIGLIYKNQGNYEKALVHHLKALKIREEIGNMRGVSDSYNNIAVIYEQQENYEKALDYYFKSLTIQEEITDKNGVASSYNNIAIIYGNQGNYKKALENHLKSLKIKVEIGDKLGIAISYLNIGNLYSKDGKFQPSNYYFNQSLVLFKKLGFKDGIADVYSSLSELYEKKGDFEQAFTYHKLYSNIKDTLIIAQSGKQIAELQIKYETEKKEKELEFQAHKLSEQELSISHGRLLLIFITTGSLLLLILIYVAFSRYKIKKESQEKSEMLRHQEILTKAIIETQENERKRIAQDLHDGVGHKLTTLKLNFEKIAEGVNRITLEQKNIFEQTEFLLDETHKEVRAMSHSMMPKALQEREFEGAISDLVEQTLANSTQKYSLKNDSLKELPSAIQIGLYRVLQELLNNILKHAHSSEIAIQVFKNKNNIIMMVEDNGIGIQNDNASFGIGLRNIAGRINALNGVFSIEPGPVKGTIATIRIPV